MSHLLSDYIHLRACNIIFIYICLLFNLNSTLLVLQTSRLLSLIIPWQNFSTENLVEKEDTVNYT